MNLRTARLRKNMTQEELATEIGVTSVMISHYEQGNSIPRPAVRRRIDQFFGYTINWPDQERPLNALEQSRMWDALRVAAYRLGDYAEALDLFVDKDSDEIRKLIKTILGAVDEIEPLLPADMKEKGENNNGT